MKKLAEEVVAAIKDGKQEAASSALSKINTTCDDCHEDYRG